MIDTLRVLQWNAARSLAAIHSLTPLIANNPQPPHLLLIQEPPWYQIGTQPSLTDAAGTPIFNVPSIAGYTPCLPPTTPPRVVTYVSRSLPPSSWSIIGAASYATDVLTIEVRSTQLIRLCNYYGMHERGVKHGDIRTTAMDISFSILFEFYFIFSLYFEALLYYLYRSFHAYVIRASKRQRHC